MEHFAGLAVSLEMSSVCVVDATGRIVREAKVASEPEAPIAWFRGLDLEVSRGRLAAGPLSQRLYAAGGGAGGGGEPEAPIAWFRGLGLEVSRVGLEAGPLSQWLYAAMHGAGLA